MAEARRAGDGGTWETKEWGIERGVIRYKNTEGLLHRENGPALIWGRDRFEWLKNGSPHRVGGPAHVWDEHEEWSLDGVLHRLDGIAKTGTNGYYVNGLRYGAWNDFQAAVIEYCVDYPDCPSVLDMMQRNLQPCVIEYCAEHPDSDIAELLRRVQGLRVKGAKCD